MPDAFDDTLLTVQINAISAAIGAQAAAKVAPLGLDGRMISVLFAVESLGHPSQQDIVTRTGIDRTTVSRTIDQLQAAGLLHRRLDPRHRRRNWIELTAEAPQTIAQVRQTFLDCDAAFLAPLTPADRRQLADILRKLQPSASRISGHNDT